MAQAQIDQARALLQAGSAQPSSPWSLLGAATLAALAARLMAGVMILGPGVSFEAPSTDRVATPY